MFYTSPNDYRNYVGHSLLGKWKWKEHKYVDIVNGRYIYPEDIKKGFQNANPHLKSAEGNMKRALESSSRAGTAAKKMADVSERNRISQNQKRQENYTNYALLMTDRNKAAVQARKHAETVGVLLDKKYTPSFRDKKLVMSRLKSVKYSGQKAMQEVERYKRANGLAPYFSIFKEDSDDTKSKQYYTETTKEQQAAYDYRKAAKSDVEKAIKAVDESVNENLKNDGFSIVKTPMKAVKSAAKGIVGAGKAIGKALKKIYTMASSALSKLVKSGGALFYGLINRKKLKSLKKVSTAKKPTKKAIKAAKKVDEETKITGTPVWQKSKVGTIKPYKFGKASKRLMP